MDNKDNFYLEETFIESPLYDNWFKKHYPQKSFLICSPYIKQDALDKIIKLYDLDKRASDFELKILMRGNEDEFTYSKSSDISIFDTLIPISGVDISNIRRITNLHMKAYLIDGKHLLISSGNLTNSGMFVVSRKENFEGGISTNNISLIFKFLGYFRKIWEQSEEVNDFYDDLMNAYTQYVKIEYSDKNTLRQIKRKQFSFNTKTQFQQIDTNSKEQSKRSRDTADCTEENDRNDLSLNSILEHIHTDKSYDDTVMSFVLSDIPPVGMIEHLEPVLKITNQYENGITYLELGKKLRPLFSSNSSTSDVANRKFGEEKGKFAAFMNLVMIEENNYGSIIKINNLGRTYLNMSEENRSNMIKDIFFDKPLVVSIMRQSMGCEDFNLLAFLVENCQGATKSTLTRKVSPLKDLFRHISAICTDEELRKAMHL